MIPKIIHYCWFGGNKLPALEKNCLKSWSVYLPDFEVRCWSEETVDMEFAPAYVKSAYKLKRYAFVSDYYRVKALYLYGGIYFDADLELIKILPESFLQNKAVLGFETSSHVGTAVMMFEPRHPILRELLNYYEANDFVNRFGVLDITANVALLTDILKEKGLKLNKKEQVIAEIMIMERDFFYPKLSDGKASVTEKTISIHHYSCSWLSESQFRRGRSKLWRHCIRPILRGGRLLIKCIFGKNIMKTIENYIRWILK